MASCSLELSRTHIAVILRMHNRKIITKSAPSQSITHVRNMLCGCQVLAASLPSRIKPLHLDKPAFAGTSKLSAYNTFNMQGYRSMNSLAKLIKH